MRFLVLLLLPLLILACSDDGTNNEAGTAGEPEFKKEGTLEFVRPDGSIIRSIDIEIAEEPKERQQGLMYRRKMTLGEGMLFLFPTADDRSFWMANTPIPLDIMFVGPDSQIVNIARRTRPMSQEFIESTAPTQYVVEVRGGFSDRYGITDSTRIRWQRTP